MNQTVLPIRTTASFVYSDSRRLGRQRARAQRFILKAVVQVKGRALSIYGEVHPMRCYNNAKTHRRFLHPLQSTVPEGCCPIVVTDAGFRRPWFRDVEALGWDWVGRIRNRIKYLRPENGTLVLHPFAVPIGQRSDTPYRQAMSVASAPVLGPAVSGARLVLSAWSASQAPQSSSEVSAHAPNPVAARHLVALSPWGRHAHQAHLRPTHADRGDHSQPPEPPLRIRPALRANEASRSSRSLAARRRARHVDSVAAGFRRCRAAMGPTLPTPNGVDRFSRQCSLTKSCGAIIGSESHFRNCSEL